MSDSLKVILSVLAIWGGVVWGAYEHYVYELNNKQQEKPEIATTPRAVIKDTKDDKASKTSEVSVKAVPAAVSAEDNAKAKSILDEAKQLYWSADYSMARDMLLQVDSLSCENSFKDEAGVLLEKVNACIELTEQIVPSDLSTGKDIVKLYLANGKEWIGKILRENDFTVYVEKLDGISISIQKSKIDKKEHVSKEEWKAYLTKEYDNKRATRNLTAEDQYKLACYCMENGLMEYVTFHLDRALKIDSNLVNTLRASQEKQYMNELAETCPDSPLLKGDNKNDAALKTRIEQALSQTESKAATKRAANPNATDEELKGDSYFDKAIVYYREACNMPKGTKTHKKTLKMATQYFDKALEEYRKAAKKEKNKSIIAPIEEKIRQANQFRYGCMKMQTL